jgi:hypothetical protein
VENKKGFVALRIKFELNKNFIKIDGKLEQVGKIIEIEKGNEFIIMAM